MTDLRPLLWLSRQVGFGHGSKLPARFGNVAPCADCRAKLGDFVCRLVSDLDDLVRCSAIEMPEVVEEAAVRHSDRLLPARCSCLCHRQSGGLPEGSPI